MTIDRMTDWHTYERRGYELGLTADDTEAWAHRAGSRWPCSKLAGHTLFVHVRRAGLLRCLVDGVEPEGIDAAELAAIVADHLTGDLRHLWPTWHNESARMAARAE